MTRVLCLGDACADVVIPFGSYKSGQPAAASFSCGGACANSAFGLGRLNVPVSFFGLAGDDLYGREMKRQLADNGVDVSAFILSRELVSTQVLIVLDENHDRHPFLMPARDPSYLQIHPEDLDRIDLDRFSHILTNGMMFFQEPAASSIPAFLQQAHDRGIRILMDINYRPETIKADQKLFRQAVALSDILLGSIDDDLLPLSGCTTLEEAVEKLSNPVIIARDSSGARVFEGNRSFKVSSFPVKVKDSTGAGDAFNAGFIYGTIKGYPLADCSLFGCACAALCIQKEGARSLPDEKQLSDFIKAQSA